MGIIIDRAILWLKGKIASWFNEDLINTISNNPGRIDSLNLISKSALIGYWKLNYFSKKNYISDQVYQILQINNKNFSNDINSIIEKSFYPEDQEIILQLMDKSRKKPSENWFDFRLQVVHGNDKWVRIKFHRIYNERDELIETTAIIQDITEFKNSNNRINEMLELKDAMLEVSHINIDVKNIIELFDIILDKVTKAIKKTDLACVFALDNNKELKMIAHKGYNLNEGEEFRIKLEDSFFWKKTEGKIKQTVTINNIKKDFPELYDNVLDNEKEIIVNSSMSAPILVEGDFYGLINIDSGQNDIFDETDWLLMEYVRKQVSIAISKHKLYEKTIHLTRYDKLTNIYNRRYFEELIAKRIKESIRYKKEFQFVIFDLDGLKVVNDTYGHLAGDKLIIGFVNYLKESIRTTDIIARFGGDEFVGIFLEIDNINDLTKKLERIKNSLYNQPIIFEENSFNCSFSYGISSFPYDGLTYDKLVKIADKRMYDYKKISLNRSF